MCATPERTCWLCSVLLNWCHDPISHRLSLGSGSVNSSRDLQVVQHLTVSVKQFDHSPCILLLSKKERNGRETWNQNTIGLKRHFTQIWKLCCILFQTITLFILWNIKGDFFATFFRAHQAPKAPLKKYWQSLWLFYKKEQSEHSSKHLLLYFMEESKFLLKHSYKTDCFSVLRMSIDNGVAAGRLCRAHKGSEEWRSSSGFQDQRRHNCPSQSSPHQEPHGTYCE